MIPVDANAPEDPTVAELSDFYSGKLAEQLAAPVRAVDQPWQLTRDMARSQETALGQLVAEAFRQAMDSDIGFASAGGLRADLIAAPPALTLADVAAVLPFDNRLVRLKITGAELRELMELALAGHPDPRNAFPLISGITVQFDPEAQPGKRVTTIEHEGKAVQPDQVLSIVTSLFLADGGDGYSLLSTLERDAVGPLDREALAAWLTKMEPWPPAQAPSSVLGSP